MTITGALIIFITFVVKEQKRDELKDIVSAISSAQSGYKVREDIEFTMGETQEVIRRVDALTNDITLVNPPKRPREEYGAVVLMGEIRIMQINNHSLLGTAVNLFEELPERPARAQDQLNALTKRYRQLATDVEQLKSRIAEEAVKQAQKNWNTELTYSAGVRAQMTRLFDNSQALSTDIRGQRDEIRRIAVTERMKSEQQYEKYAKFSIYLYIVGWLLGLTGKLWAGAEGDPGTD